MTSAPRFRSAMHCFPLPLGMWTCLLVVLSFNGITSAEAELVLLPVAGAELIDGGMVIGSPPGDPDPRRGSGHVLRPNATEVALDYLGRSIVVDLGQLQLVQRIEVCSTYDTNGKIQNLNEETLELYHSIDNIHFERVTGYVYRARAADMNDAALRGGGEQKKLRIHNVIELSELRIPTRYLKVHSGYKGRNYDFVAPPDRLIRAYGRPGVAAQDRVRLPLGLLQCGTNSIGVNARHFEPLSSLNCRIRLAPLGRGPLILNVAEHVPLNSDASREWHDLKLEVPNCEPGLYRLTIERIDPAGNLSLWVHEQEIRVVNDIKHLDAAGAGKLTVLSGDCLLVRPHEITAGWRVDSADLAFPLWRGVGALELPVELETTCAVYVGLLGSDQGLTLRAGDQRLAPISSSRGASSAMHESYLGILGAGMRAPLTIHLEDEAKDSGIAWIKLLALTPRQIRLAAGKEDLSRQCKLIYVSDGMSWFGEFDYKPVRRAEDIEAKATALRETGGLVQRFDWCPGSSTVIWGYPTQVGEIIGQRTTYPRNLDRYITENIRELFAQGQPPLKVIAEASRRNGLKSYAAIRMASYHTPPYDDFYNSDFWRQHPEYRILYYDGRPNECLSYAFPEVRELYLNLIREMLDYGVDGIHFEFLRDATLLGSEQPVVESFQAKYGKSPLDPDFEDWERWYRHRTEIMTGYVRSVRTLLDEEGKRRNTRFGLSARIPCYDYWQAGLDPKTWMSEGLVDLVAIGSNQLPNPPMPLEPFLEMAQGTSCKIYSSFEDALGDGRDPEPADDAAGVDPGWHSHASEDASRDYVVSELRKGAQGIYRFNSEGNDWTLYQNLERWDEFQNPRRLSIVPYKPATPK